MPRRTTSPTMLIVNFFMSAPLAEAKQALDTAKAIVASREAAGLVQPSLPAAPAAPRRRRGRKAKSATQEALPGTTQAAGATGPVAVPDAPKPQRRRRSRPAVGDTPATATAAPGTTEPVIPAGVTDLSSLPAATE